MNQERRRYFRLNEDVGLSVQVLDSNGAQHREASKKFAPNAVELIGQHDDGIERLIRGIADESPDVARLARLLNKKIERVANMMAMDNHLLDRIAHRIQEVNISACGLAFSHEELIPEGSRLRLTLTLYPEESKVEVDGLLVACELTSEGDQSYFCRVDFYAISPDAQEQLIQHMVKRQSSQLRTRRET